MSVFEDFNQRIEFYNKILEIIDTAEVFEAYTDRACGWYVKISRREYSKPIYFHLELCGIITPRKELDFFGDLTLLKKPEKRTDEEGILRRTIKNMLSTDSIII